MTEIPREERPAAPAACRWVKVWDLPTRRFHWLLVGLVVVGVVTGYLTPEWWMGVHIWAGYGLVALMAFRLVWGICGPEYSRVVSFLSPPRHTVEHLRGLVLLRPPHYVGHNPTGALMVFALTGVLIALVTTGLLVLGGEEKQGPLSTVIGYSVGFGAKHVHRWPVLLLLVLVACHVAGVVAESLLMHDNLVWAIITGWKRLPPEAPVPTLRPARPLLALLAGGAVGTLQWLSQFPPPHSLRTLPPNPTHQQECGACHYALNPGLLPAASWAALMASLGEHFGENASLDGPDVHHFLLTDLLEHERLDEEDIYPAIAAQLSGEDPLGALSRTHQELFHLARLLDLLIGDLPAAGPDPHDLPDIRRLLYSLHAVLRLRFAQEEELYQSVSEPENAAAKP